MRPLPVLLLSSLLVAQEPGPLDLRTDLGCDPAVRIRLAPSGCWDALILGGPLRPQGAPDGAIAGATVEVWDLALRESPRRQAFAFYLEDLRDRLARSFAAPPPSQGQIELAELVFSDPSSPQKLDLTKVTSMQNRFNRLPPSGSPVRR